MAQLAPEKGRHPHLDHPQLGTASGDVAATHGNPSTLQSLRVQYGGIPPTLPARMSQGVRSMGCLQKSMGQLGSSRGARHQLALYSTRGTGPGKGGRPSWSTRLPCRRLLLPTTTLGHSQKLHLVPHLDRKMQKALRGPTLRQKHTHPGLGGHCRGRYGHVESYQVSARFQGS
jgi:hypothetical protein